MRSLVDEEYAEGWADGEAAADVVRRDGDADAALAGFRTELEAAKHARPPYDRYQRAYWLGVLRAYRWYMP